MTLMEWPGGSWEATTGMVVAVIAAYVAVLWMALVFWTVRDIHQRTRDTATQVLAGLLVLFFFLPGHWLYLILRPRLTLAERYERTLEAEAVLQELSDHSACPRCNKRVKDDFVHCPSCRARLKRACANCQRPMDFAWAICPSCGMEPKRRTTPATGAQPPVIAGAPPAPPPAALPAAEPVAEPVLAAATVGAAASQIEASPPPPEMVGPVQASTEAADVQPFPGRRGPTAKERRALATASASSSNGNGHANGASNGNGNGHDPGHPAGRTNGHLPADGAPFPYNQEFPNGSEAGH